jgi:hypothetical protein
MRKQKTRKRVRKNRRYKRRTKRRSQRRQRSYRLRGGNYAKDVTIEEVDDMPVTAGAVIDIPGYPSMSVKDFKAHALYRDFQGEEQ